MKEIRIIKIDAHTQDISYELLLPSLTNMKQTLQANSLLSVRLYSYPNVFMLLDENSRHWCDEEKLYFSIDEWILVNRTVLVGVDGDGEWCDVDLHLKDIKPRVTFLPINYVNEPLDIKVMEFPNVS